MDKIVFLNIAIMANIILAFIIKEMYKSIKKKDEIIRLQDNWLKSEGLIKLN
jgi:hypothetical protein